MKKFQLNYSILTLSVAFVLTALSSIYLYSEFYGHLSFWFDSNYWECTWSYFLSHLKSAALSQYVAEFLLLGFKWQALAVIVFMLPVFSVFLLLFRLMQKVGLNSIWLISSIFPSVMLFVLQTHRLFFFFYSIYILVFYIALLGFLSNRFRAVRYILTPISYPLLYLFLPSGMLILLYVSFLFIEIFYFRKKEKMNFSWSVFAYFSIICLAICFLYPMGWNVWVEDEMAMNNYLGLGFFFDVKNQKLMTFLLFVLPILMLFLYPLIKIRTKKMELSLFAMQSVVLVTFIVWVLPFKKYASFENYFRIEKAVFSQDWDEVIRLSKSQKEKIDQLFPYTVLAHATKGDLPEKMFNYPLSLNSPFIPIYDRKNITMQSNIMFYSLCGLYNMAIRCAMEDASIRLIHDDFFVLKTLAMLNAQNGNVEVTQKYINKLKLTLVHDDYIEKIEEVLNNYRPGNEQSEELYFMSDNKLMEIYKFSEKYKLTLEARDLLLCGILQKRDYKTFASVFFKVFPYKTEKIPTVYEEFLLLAPLSGIELAESDFVVSEATKKRFDNFMQIYTQQNDPNLKKYLIQKHHGDTWWNYAVFGN